MNLDRYLLLNEITITDFARAIDVSPVTIYRIMAEERCHTTVALKIILATNQEVSFFDLYPQTIERLKDDLAQRMKEIKEEKELCLDRRKRRKALKKKVLS